MPPQASEVDDVLRSLRVPDHPAETAVSEQERIDRAVAFAVDLAAAGFGVVEAYAPADTGGCTCQAGTACHSPGKHPVGDDWQRRATRSPHTIEQRVRDRAGQYGVIPWAGERGLILDIDHPDRLPLRLPPSLRVLRGPDRGHAYFRLPAGYRAATLPATAPWGDIRVEGANRHVIGPYSRHASGDVYQPTATAADIAELPAGLLEQLFPPSEPGLRLKVGGYQLPEPGYTGSRYFAVRDYIASRYHRNMTEAELWLGVRDVLAPLFAEPLPEAELRQRFERARRGTPENLGPPAGNHEAPAERPLAFRSARELAAETPTAYEYVSRPWVAVGALHELTGKPKTAGKTTLMLHMVGAVLDGAPFLGAPTMQTPVVLLSEQSRRSLVPALRALGLDRDELAVLTWPDAIGTSWPAIVAAAVDECQRIGARLLVIDTLTPFVGLGAEMENDASAALAAMQPLQAAAQDHELAVLLLRHDRKAGGDVAESGRGSNAWSGAVDCVMALRRQPNPARPGIRELEAISRRGDVPEESLLIELTDTGYVPLGAPGPVAFDEARQLVRECLSGQQDTTLAGQTLDELAAAIERPRITVRRAVGALIAAGEVDRTGKGRAGDPLCYAVTLGSAESGQRPSYGGTGGWPDIRPRTARPGERGPNRLRRHAGGLGMTRLEAIRREARARVVLAYLKGTTQEGYRMTPRDSYAREAAGPVLALVVPLARIARSDEDRDTRERQVHALLTEWTAEPQPETEAGVRRLLRAERELLTPKLDAWVRAMRKLRDGSVEPATYERHHGHGLWHLSAGAVVRPPDPTYRWHEVLVRCHKRNAATVREGQEELLEQRSERPSLGESCDLCIAIADGNRRATWPKGAS